MNENYINHIKSIPRYENISNILSDKEKVAIKNSFFELITIIEKYKPDFIILPDTHSRPFGTSVNILKNKVSPQSKVIFLPIFRDKGNSFGALHNFYIKDKENYIHRYITNKLECIDTIPTLTVDKLKRLKTMVSDNFDPLISRLIDFPSFQENTEPVIEQLELKRLFDNLYREEVKRLNDEYGIEFEYVPSDESISSKMSSEYIKAAQSRYMNGERTLFTDLDINFGSNLSKKQIKLIETRINITKFRLRSLKDEIKLKSISTYHTNKILNLANSFEQLGILHSEILDMEASEFLEFLNKLRDELIAGNIREKAEFEKSFTVLSERLSKSGVTSTSKILVVDELFASGSTFNLIIQYLRKLINNKVDPKISFFAFDNDLEFNSEIELDGSSFPIHFGNQKSFSSENTPIRDIWATHEKSKFTLVTKPSGMGDLQNISGTSTVTKKEKFVGNQLRKELSVLAKEVINNI